MIALSKNFVASRIIKSEKKPANGITSTALSGLLSVKVVNRINYITISNARREIVRSAMAGYPAQPKYTPWFFPARIGTDHRHK